MNKVPQKPQVIRAFRRLELEVPAELFVGGVLTILLLRWIAG